MERMSIGEFARASGLTPKALRLYDETGLLPPAEVDGSSGYRYYTGAQLDRARLVARLRLVGMPLARIRAVADLPDEARAADLASYWRQVEADTASRRAMVATLVGQMRTEEITMSMSDTTNAHVAVRSGTGARDTQLDALRTGTRLFAVADGFGGDPDLAGRALAELAPLDDATGEVDPVRLLDDAVTSAAAAVTKQAEAAGEPVAGCTLTALVLGTGRAVVAHVGDSRAYLVRGGRLERLTRDHTVVQTLVDEGSLTEDEARSHEQRAHLNRALAPGVPPMPDISVHTTLPGDRFVLTTDGVHAVLPPGQLSSLLVGGATPEEVVAGVEEAVRDGGAPDNYAVVVVDLAG